MVESHYAIPDVTARKNAGLTHAADYTLAQPLARYTAADQRTWQILYERQMRLLPGRACDEFLRGLDYLHLPAQEIPRFSELNRQLDRLTGWQVVAVHGLIPDRIFFEHLANRRFPVTWWIREPGQIDYLQEPDLFHDLFGHVPLLTNPVFADYLQAYGRGGLKAFELHALPMLARLYWYTVEFGLIRTAGGLRIYGAGILSSRTESLHSLQSDEPHRVGFELLRIMRTNYHIDQFQQTYFVIDSFDQLFEATAPDFAAYYRQLEVGAEYAPGEFIPGDKLVTIG
jgi:phenylalanine-4-hydroxylase